MKRAFITLLLFLSTSLSSQTSETSIALSVIEPVADSYARQPGGFVFTRSGDLSQILYIPIILVGSRTDGPENIAGPGIDYSIETVEFFENENPVTSATSGYSDVIGAIAMPANSQQVALKVIPASNWYNHSDKVVALEIFDSPESFTISGSSYAEYSITNRSYSLWAENRQLPNTIDDATLDSDKDGQSNLAEYALLSDPQSPSSIGKITPEIVIINETRHLGVTFDRLSEAEDLLEFSLETLSSNSDWQPAATQTLVKETRSDGSETATLYLESEPDSAPILLRVKISLKSSGSGSS